MQDHAVHRASELARDERLLVEPWLGRALSNDETISVNVYRPHAAPSGDEHHALRQDILDQAREIGSRAPHVPEEEADVLVDEALAKTRRGRG